MFENLEEKEAVERAALIEKNGYKFYSLLISKISDARVKEALRDLAHDEQKHLKTLESVYFPEAGLGDEITEEELEIEEYVKKLGVPDLFTRRIDLEKLVAAVDEPKKALLIALDTEIHAAEYFEKMAAAAKTKGGKAMYKELAEEERGHVSRIEELLAMF
ncbi:MAG: ferritin family protein [Deltaproteobacteria bacterium]|nr:ferritin family protein [Deltaproteobacteria bacterium]